MSVHSLSTVSTAAPQPLATVRALYNYTPEASNDELRIPLKKGDVVVVEKKLQSGWWYGYVQPRSSSIGLGLNDDSADGTNDAPVHRGFFPSNFCVGSLNELQQAMGRDETPRREGGQAETVGSRRYTGGAAQQQQQDDGVVKGAPSSQSSAVSEPLNDVPHVGSKVDADNRTGPTESGNPTKHHHHHHSAVVNLFDRSNLSDVSSIEPAGHHSKQRQQVADADAVRAKASASSRPGVPSNPLVNEYDVPVQSPFRTEKLPLAPTAASKDAPMDSSDQQHPHHSEQQRQQPPPVELPHADGRHAVVNSDTGGCGDEDQGGDRTDEETVSGLVLEMYHRALASNREDARDAISSWRSAEKRVVALNRRLSELEDTALRVALSIQEERRAGSSSARDVRSETDRLLLSLTRAAGNESQRQLQNRARQADMLSMELTMNMNKILEQRCTAIEGRCAWYEACLMSIGRHSTAEGRLGSEVEEEARRQQLAAGFQPQQQYQIFGQPMSAGPSPVRAYQPLKGFVDTPGPGVWGPLPDSPPLGMWATPGRGDHAGHASSAQQHAEREQRNSVEKRKQRTNDDAEGPSSGALDVEAAKRQLEKQLQQAVEKYERLKAKYHKAAGRAQETEASLRNYTTKLEAAVQQRDDLIAQLRSDLEVSENRRLAYWAEVCRMQGPVRVVGMLQPLPEVSPSFGSSPSGPLIQRSLENPAVAKLATQECKFDMIYDKDVALIDVVASLSAPQLEAVSSGDRTAVLTYGTVDGGKSTVLEAFAEHILFSLHGGPTADSRRGSDASSATSTPTFSRKVTLYAMEVFHDRVYDVLGGGGRVDERGADGSLSLPQLRAATPKTDQQVNDLLELVFHTRQQRSPLQGGSNAATLIPGGASERRKNSALIVSVTVTTASGRTGSIMLVECPAANLAQDGTPAEGATDSDLAQLLTSLAHAPMQPSSTTSTLTRILHPHLAGSRGNTQALLVVAVPTSRSTVLDSWACLKFGSKVRQACHRRRENASAPELRGGTSRGQSPRLGGPLSSELIIE